MATPSQLLTGNPLPTGALSLEKMRRLTAGDELAVTHVLELLGSLQATDEEIRAGAADALQTIDNLPSSSAERVAELCGHANPAVAAAACRLVSKLGAQATDYQAAVVGCLTGHANFSARQQAAWALGSISHLSPESRAALKQAALSDDPRLQRLANLALNENMEP